MTVAGPQEREGDQQGRHRLTGSNLLQLGVTIAVAVLVAVAGVLSSQAGDRWQSMVRLETKRSAALLENTAYVYEGEAPPALNIALLATRARVLGGTSGALARGTLNALPGPDKGPLAAIRAYDRADRSADLGRRLADLQRSVDLQSNPDAAQRAGDDRSREAMNIALLVVPLLAAYLLIELVLRCRQRRGSAAASAAVDAAPDSGASSPASCLGDAVESARGVDEGIADHDRLARSGEPDADARSDDVALVPRPWSVPSARRFGVIIAFVAWLAVSLLAVAQVSFANAEQHSQALASRKTIELSTTIATSDTRSYFGAANVRQTVIQADEAITQALVAQRIGDRAATPALEDEASAFERSLRYSILTDAEMAQTPTTNDGADAFTVASLGATRNDVLRAAADQGRDVDRADTAGNRSTRISVAILLAGLALSISALAGVRATGLNTTDAAAGCLLIVALLTAGSVLLT